MIKYLGSKRLLIPVLGNIASVAHSQGARTALDLFSGTTRVAQEFKRKGLQVTACDIASYSEILAQCYIATDASQVNLEEIDAILQELSALPGKRGYFTKTFCEDSQYFQVKNGIRVDAIRDAIEEDYKDHPTYPVLLTSLMLAADRVDSTAGIQMAYLKEYAQRSYNDLELRIPELIEGAGSAIRGDALELAGQLEPFDIAYLDPPYNQHRYFTNYHIWETLVRWDAPEHYGKACKRIDARDDETKSAFNKKPQMADSLHRVIKDLKAETLVVSYNNESWVSAEQIEAWLSEKGYDSVQIFNFDFKRYVGAKIGIYNQKGKKVGKVDHLNNIEHIIVGGSKELLDSLRESIA
ncbi:MAG: DNA adenine methylase [Coriobacteriia bacterium]|nr:DNA adenine methylase [Coriobacteriia bacterium]